MNTFNSVYFEELIAARRKKTVRNRIFMVTAALIVFVTSYVLILPAITMSHETFCGQEHEHIQQCYSDPTADLETVEDWEAALPTDLSGTASENLQRVAESQLGYTESIKNFQIVDGVQKGYTRYGAWSGQPYEDWGQLFVEFCLEYAGVTDDYETAVDEEPLPGDLLLIDGIEKGIITEVDTENNSLTAIEGDSMDQVRYVTYELTDDRITEYGLIAERIDELTSEEIASEDSQEPESELGEAQPEDQVQPDESPSELDPYNEEQTAANEPVESQPEEQVLLITEEQPAAAPEEESEGEQTAETAIDTDEKALEYADENITIQAKLPEGVQIPDTAELQVTKRERAEKGYIEDASLAAMTADKVILDQHQYSLALVDGDQQIELEEPMQVSMTYSPESLEEGLESQALIVEVSEDESSVIHKAEVEEGEAIAAAFETTEVNSYNILLMADPAVLPAGKYGKFTLSYNEVKDAFVKDSAYDVYYNENSPLGTAGSFHLVGFGTVTLSTHTNGNVLAKTLIAHSNFGTNSFEDELTYAQYYKTVNGGSGSQSDHMLVIGSDNNLTVGHNRDEFHVNGTKIDRPDNLMQDVDSAARPFIDLVRVENEINGIAERLAAVEDSGLTIDFTDENNRSITLNDPSGAGFYTTTAQKLQAISNFADRKIKMRGFAAGQSGSIVVNIDCTGITEFNMPEATVFVGDKEQNTDETVNFSNGKVIWNFINAEGVTIKTKRMTGMVVAPGATVEITQNLNGTVVAENIHVKAESHRTDFTGDVDPGGDNPSGVYLKVRKVDADNISVYLDKARFDLYKWDKSAGKYVIVQEDMSYEDGKPLMLNDLVYNVAYRLVEVTAPAEYKLSDKPYDFIIPHANKVKYPEQKPADFEDNEIEAGHTIFFKNEKITELIIKKLWTDSDGNPKTVTDTEILIDVWRNAYSNEDHTELIGSGEYKTGLKVTAANNWTLTIPDLPKTGIRTVGGVQTKVYYTYFIKEQQHEQYNVMYEGNGGVVSGVITITNVEKAKYLIPETGGPGTYLCAMAGLFFMTMGTLLLVIYRLRRREVSD